MKRSDIFPSKYACADDLNGQRVPVTMDRIVLEDVEDDDGKKSSAGIVYFRDMQKGLRLNRTNFDTIAATFGEETDSWPGKEITLFPTTTTFKGERKACIRIEISPEQAQRSAAVSISDQPSTTPTF